MQEITIRFVKNNCWKCGFEYFVCYVLPQGNTINHAEVFNPQILSKIKEWQSDNFHITLGTVKERYSNTTQTSYISFGCPKCDAIFGDWYFKELIIDTMYDEQGDIADFVFKDCMRGLQTAGLKNQEIAQAQKMTNSKSEDSQGRSILDEESGFFETSQGSLLDIDPRRVEEIHDLSSKDKPSGAKVLCAVSGGVDSSVVATLLYRAIGENVIPIFVDTGLLRKGEREAVEKMFKENLKVPLITVDASEEFLGLLKGVKEPETKRKIIGETFIKVFEREAKKHNAKGEIKFLAQGTLYPDVIESVSVKGPSKTIKSHHNVGGLPEWMKFELIEPLRELFKDEVRALGRELGMPESMLMRHPFPGPGLAIRIMGEVTKQDLDLLREADSIFIEELHKWNLYDKVWQAFCVLLNVRSVGVMGDNRTYDNTVCVRAVEALDGMTATFSHLPHEFLESVSNRIINEVAGINRVVYDITSKPPGTIEWE